MKLRERLVQRTIDVHREIVQARLGRRELLKMGLLGSGSGMLLPIPGLSLRAAWGSGACPEPGKEIFSPSVRPWRDEMPRLREKTTVEGNGPSGCSHDDNGGAPGADPVGNLSGGDSKVRLCEEYPSLREATPYPNLNHQGWGRGGPLGEHLPQDWYEMRVRQFNHVWHRDMPAGAAGQPAWGFDSVFPGPMFRTRYGRSHFVRIHNDLPERNLGFGINQITTHLHNHHTPSESDGNPLYTNYPGHYWDYHYPNVYAGVNQFGGIGDFREALGTLWYHDHKLDFTAQNVYAGLAGMNCIYDELDTGDPDEATGLRLPCGPNYEFDVGLVFHDRQFDTRGEDFFPLTCFDGAIGDKLTVNGKIQPYFPVKRRKYRFRMLNIGPSRYYWWWLSNGAPFVVIANDGNLLPAPVLVKGIKQGVAERFDVILDFSQYTPGTQIVLLNRAEQRDGRGPTGKLLNPGMPALKFVVTSDPVVDNSVIPRRLRPLPNIDQPVAKRRYWKFERSGGEWVVNGEPYNRDVIHATIPEGSAEIWTIENGGGSWSHPVHIHYEEHRFLTFNNAAQGVLEQGRKDVINLEPNAKVEVYMRFRDYKGQYVMHCHNVVHEDHAMMINFKIV